VIERKIEGHIRLFELKRGALERKIERKIETQKKKIGLKFETQKKKFETHIRRFEEKNGIRFDDEVRFFRSWIEKPLAIGAVTPSGKALARTMACFVDPKILARSSSLAPALAGHRRAGRAGIDPSRLVLVEFDPTFCRCCGRVIPPPRSCRAMPMVCGGFSRAAASRRRRWCRACHCSPNRCRCACGHPEAFSLMLPGAPFVQFTYAAYSPIPKALDRVKSEASERVWANIPPARVWVYRRH
jgi:phosphatidylethanolamine/phosphatidyl-N-methylethanolamine N-methyltransferase